VFLRTVALVFLPLAGLAAVVLAVGIGFTAGWQDLGLVIGGGCFLLTQSWYDLNLSLVTADQQPGRYGLLGAIRAVGGLGFGALAAGLGFGPVGVIAGYVIGNLIAGAWAFHVGWRGHERGRLDPDLRLDLLRYGLPLVGAFLLAYLIMAADRFLLAALISPEAAGVYAPSYDLVLQVIATLMVVINLAAFPLAVDAVEEENPAKLSRHFRHHLTLLIGIGLPAAAGIAVLAPSISGILGPRFAPAARDLLPVLALAQLIAGFKAYYLDLSFQLGRATRLQLMTVAIGAVVNVVLNLSWIPVFGILGSAYATLVAYVVACLASYAIGRRVLRLPLPLGALLRLGVATAGMCVALLPVREATGALVLAGQVALGASVYGGLLLALTRGDPRRLLPA